MQLSELAFFKDNYAFEPNTIQHWIGLSWSITLAILLSLYVKYKCSPEEQRRWVLRVSMFLMLYQISKVFIRIKLGVFDITNDLPFHLCNMLPFFVPFALYYRNRLRWAILYYWIMAGTIQALITVTLDHAYPHYDYFRYWFLHVGLIMLALWGPFIFGMRAYWRDTWKGLIAISALAGVIYLVNEFLGANYMYMQEKPAGNTPYDYFGPWPYYIITLHFICILSFLILTIPFYVFNKRSIK